MERSQKKERHGPDKSISKAWTNKVTAKQQSLYAEGMERSRLTPYFGISPYPAFTAVACKRPHTTTLSFCSKCMLQVTPKCAYILGPSKSEWADYTVQAQSGNPSGKWAHTQLARECSSSCVSPLSHSRSIISPSELHRYAPADHHFIFFFN